MVALVGGVRSWAFRRGRGRCPDCDAPVLAKCGPIVVWHWAHEAGADCPFEHEPETEWHRAWKARFPIELVEQRVGARRVDVLLPDGTAVEFQHSSIAVDEIRRREWATPRMTWVFDVRAAVAAGRFMLRRPGESAGDYRTFRWCHPRKTIGTCSKRVLLDLFPGPWAALLSLGAIYTDAPCGGYGWLVSPQRLWPLAADEETPAA